MQMPVQMYESLILSLVIFRQIFYGNVTHNNWRISVNMQLFKKKQLLPRQLFYILFVVISLYKSFISALNPIKKFQTDFKSSTI